MRVRFDRLARNKYPLWSWNCEQADAQYRTSTFVSNDRCPLFFVEGLPLHSTPATESIKQAKANIPFRINICKAKEAVFGLWRMNFTMRTSLQLFLCGLLLVPNIIATEVVSDENERTGKRQLGLEDYMRYTPRPTPETAAAPTIQPTTLATTEATTYVPTFTPTESPTTAAPSEAPSETPTTAAPTVAPTTEAPTKIPTTVAPTVAPTTSPVEEEPEEETTTETTTNESETAAPTDESAGEEINEKPAEEEEEDWNLLSETSEYQDVLGSVTIDFSLYSPNVTVLEMNFPKLKLGVSGSIDEMICDQGHPISEEEGPYCSVRDDVLLTDGITQSRQPSSLSDYNTTIIALSSTLVKDDSGVAPGPTPLSWTTWRMSWDVLQFGPALLQHIEEIHGADLDEDEVRAVGIAILQKMITVNVERALKDGDLQQDINDFMKDIMLVTSFVGDEVETYKIFVTHHSVSPTGSEIEEEGEGGGLMVILFFAGLGAACFVIVGLLYFSFRSRRSRIRRKRTIVILDDTAKDSEEVAKDAGTHTEPNTPTATTANTPKVEPKESAQGQEKFIVMEAGNAMKEDPPQAEAEQAQQGWEGESVDEENSISPEDGDGDVESQWGRSAAQSSAYTGSISAITGVSGLEQSDTWSVGSMSIDLAEWG
jgi:hypothetical protein